MHSKQPFDAPTRPEPGADGPADQDRLASRLARRRARRERARRRILRTTAVLPSLFTLSNGLLGFGCIHLACRDGIAAEPTMLAPAAWMLFGAMICDMLDGRLARFTRRTSDFGAQLDSLCDVISFGIAPAVLMLRTVMGAACGQVGKVAFLAKLSDAGLERVLWCAAGVYVAGAALRLARFNVENEPDESAHMEFRGLPSPGAAAVVATLVLLFERLNNAGDGGISGSWLLALNDGLALWMCAAISIVLPIITLVVGLLMVSRFRYPHLINQYIRGKRPFSYLVKIVLVALVILLEPFLALAAGAMAYALSGPIAAAWRRVRARPAEAAPPAGAGQNPADPAESP